MPKVVSVIIPCFNAEKWVAEAIDSCLQQSYPEIEIIVIDDGSTDNSLEIIKSYGDKLIWESGSNRGGNHARNRGFALSKGEYIQFLDADDYILPEKIERQVRFLEETGADVVYGDWRHRRHFPDGKNVLEDIEIPGKQPDILDSLLINWWTAPASLLYTRATVIKSGGWDESLKAAQDRDFLISVVMSGAKVVYQPGCYSIYRRYGNVTVSTACKQRWWENHRLVLEKAETNLSKSNNLSKKYRYALARGYFDLARQVLPLNYHQYLQFIEKLLALYPEFEAKTKRKSYNFVQKILGFRVTERLTSLFVRSKKLLNLNICL